MTNLIQELQLSAANRVRVQTSILRTLVGKIVSVSLAILGVNTWCRSLYRLVQQESAWSWLDKSAREELAVLITLLNFQNGSPFLNPLTDIEMWVDLGEVGWGVSIEEADTRGQFPAWAIGTSSTARELMGLFLALRSETVSSRIKGKVVLLNMDSMCSVRNLVKGGGPVPDLVHWIKEIWKVCRDLGTTLSPRWQRRNTFMMQRVDELSKEGTEWKLREGFVADIWHIHGITVTMPDLARCGPALIAVVGRGSPAAMVLPVWEAKSWWSLAVQNCQEKVELGDMRHVVYPNEVSGYPRWDFNIFIF